MRIVYLPGTRRDLAWFRHYYDRVFPEGARGARDRLVAMETALLDSPWIGRPRIGRPRRPPLTGMLSLVRAIPP